jgi:hypothetical protein
MPHVLSRLLRIAPQAVDTSRRGFHIPPEFARNKLELVGTIFLQGYHAALLDPPIHELAPALDIVEAEFRGFAYEGAAMALDLLDQLTPWRSRRITQFLAGPAQPYVYMTIVGVGWSMARIRFQFERRFRKLDPLLRWLAIDGWGFHEGYFHWPQYADGKPRPRHFNGYGLRVFDQGLGRSIWFVGGANSDTIARLVGEFPDSRRGDLWSGIGLAAAYTGFLDAEETKLLRRASGSWWPHLAQGAVFAAKTRARAGNASQHTEEACRILTGIFAVEAVALCDLMLSKVMEGSEPAYESWRALIQDYFRG